MNGNLIADILKDSLGIDIMFMGLGAIRNESLGPVITYADLTECLPYDDAVYMLPVTGAQLKRMITHILLDEAFEGDHTEFYQFSHGMKIVWSRKEHYFREISLDGEPIKDEKIYRVAMQTFHYMDLKDFLNITLEEVEKNGNVKVLAISFRSVIEEYLSVTPNLSREVEGRLIVEN